MIPHRPTPGRRAALALLLALLALSGCGPAARTAAPQPRTAVTIQLAWVHEYSSAGFYAAEQNGHFAEQGLAVQLQEGGFTGGGYVDPIEQILAGTADFGLADAASLLLARAGGRPVVALAAVYQRSPLAIIAPEASGIERPHDLIGRRVAVADGGARRTLDTLLRAQGIAPGQVTHIPRTTYGVEPLTEGQADALVAWVINEGIQLQEAGVPARAMLMHDYGVDTYDFLLFTTEQTIAERPELVERVLRALTRGLQDVVAAPERAVELTLAYNGELNAAAQRRRMLAAIPLINPAGSRPGLMQAETWQTTARMLADQGLLAPTADVASAYTTQFLDRIYQQ